MIGYKLTQIDTIKHFNIHICCNDKHTHVHVVIVFEVQYKLSTEVSVITE